MPKKRAKMKKETDSALISKNQKALWETYRELQKKVDKAWSKIRADIRNKAKPQMLIKDRNELLLLLGECNYMAREYMKAKREKSHP